MLDRATIVARGGTLGWEPDCGVLSGGEFERVADALGDHFGEPTREVAPFMPMAS